MAAHSLAEFLEAANANTIRCTNTFEVEIVTGYNEIDSEMNKQIIYGQSFAIPQRGIELAEVSFKGYSMPLVPTKMTMEQEHTMTILDDIQGTNRRMFLAWMNKTMDADIDNGSVFAGDRGVSQGVVRLHLFGDDNDTINQTYKFVGVRPTGVSQISLTYDGGDKSQFDVTFKSIYWKIEKATEGSFTNQV